MNFLEVVVWRSSIVLKKKENRRGLWTKLIKRTNISKCPVFVDVLCFLIVNYLTAYPAVYGQFPQAIPQPLAAVAPTQREGKNYVKLNKLFNYFWFYLKFDFFLSLFFSLYLSIPTSKKDQPSRFSKYPLRLYPLVKILNQKLYTKFDFNCQNLFWALKIPLKFQKFH